MGFNSGFKGLKKVWNYTSTSPLDLHSPLQSELYSNNNEWNCVAGEEDMNVTFNTH